MSDYAAYVVDVTQKHLGPSVAILAICNNMEEAERYIEADPKLVARARIGEIGIAWPVECGHA